MHNLRLLSPLDFELLVRDLLQAEHGVLMESFGPGADGGVDFRFAGKAGDVVVQVKHYIDSGLPNLVAAAKREAEKVLKLRPSRYIFATSLELSDHQKGKLIDIFAGVPLVRSDIISGKDIDNLLGLHPRVLRQHLKLWLTNTETLERILRAGIYNRTEAEFDVIKKHVSRYVPNQSVVDAERILANRGALIISGQPGVGKTTLMRLLMCLHAEQGWQVFVVEDFKEASEVLTPGEKRLIVFDDLLGQIGFEDGPVSDADRSLPRLLQQIRGRQDARFILTTRDYIFNQARLKSDRLNSLDVVGAEMVLNVGTYTRSIRSQIVFNHIYFSDLTSAEKEELLSDSYFLKVIDHANFSPRLIETITSPEYLALQSGSIREVTEAVLTNPTVLWKRPYEEHLTQDSRRILQALFFSYTSMTPDELQASFASICSEGASGSAITVEPLRFRRALQPLVGSMIAIGEHRVEYANPGIKDFLSEVIWDDRLLRPLVGCILTLDAMTVAWSYYRRKMGQMTPEKGDKAIWIDALARCCQRDGVSPIRAVDAHLMVALGFDDDRDDFLRLAVKLMPVLSSTPPVPADSGYFKSALEQMAWLSWDDSDELEPITAIAATLLFREGASLELEDIKDLADAISEFGESPKLGKSAGGAAVKSWVAANLGPALRNEFLEDLEYLNTELIHTAEVVGVEIDDARVALALRLEDLEERSRATQSSDYKATRLRRTQPDCSDDEIRSLFSTMWG